MTPICVPIFLNDPARAIAQMNAAQAAGAQWIELRADQASPAAIASTVAARPLPVIVTVRPIWEGGRSELSDQDRVPLFEAAITAGAEYVDCELVAWLRSPALQYRLMALLGWDPTTEDAPRAPGRAKLILSNHDFSGLPEDLHLRLGRMRSIPQADVLKLAWKANSLQDAAYALTLMHHHARQDARPLLALAMGEQGQISRLLAAKYQAPFTFATLENGSESAPGQPSIHELLTTYRWNAQTPDSPVLGIAGWPVGHSLSPHIHNAGFAAIGSDAVYVPLAIPHGTESFSAAVDALRAVPNLNLRGLSVTIPHKQNALQYVLAHGGTVDALSRHIGVINTVLWDDLGNLSGTNSDYAGALDSLADALGAPRASLRFHRVAVLGAGGAAAAIVAGLAHAGATVVVYNRTMERAQALAKQFNGTPGKVVAAPWDAICKSCCDILINCTPVGMHPNVYASPVPADFPFTPGMVVFDTIYNPLETRLMRDSKAAGAKVISGLEMFVRQAAVQFELFFDLETAPLEMFRHVATARLGS